MKTEDMIILGIVAIGGYFVYVTVIKPIVGVENAIGGAVGAVGNAASGAVSSVGAGSSDVLSGVANTTMGTPINNTSPASLLGAVIGIGSNPFKFFGGKSTGKSALQSVNGRKVGGKSPPARVTVGQGSNAQVILKPVAGQVVASKHPGSTLMTAFAKAYQQKRK